MKRMVALRIVGMTALCLMMLLYGGGGSTMAVFSAKKPQAIMRATTAERRIALSFDAAWGADFTPEILKVLSAFDIRASFFLVGYWIDRYPESVSAIAAAGHDIENHSLTHPKMDALMEGDMRKEIAGLNEQVVAITGRKPTCFRPPYGQFNARIAEATHLEGMSCVLWSLDAKDWDTDDPKNVAERVLSNLRAGDILLFQTSCSSTGPALEMILPEIKKRGYEIVSVSKLIDKSVASL